VSGAAVNQKYCSINQENIPLYVVQHSALDSSRNRPYAIKVQLRQQRSTYYQSQLWVVKLSLTVPLEASPNPQNADDNTVWCPVLPIAELLTS
jgi:hypothetical protein